MNGSLENPPIVIRGKRLRAFYLLALGGLMLFSAFGVANGRDSWAAAIAPAIAGAVFLVFAIWLIVAPARLRIDAKGVRQTSFWRTRFYAWTDVHDFRPTMVGLYRKMIGFDFVTDPIKKGGVTRRFNAAVTGAQGSLLGGWEMPPEKLANLLNHAREHWLAEDAAASGQPRVVIAPPPVARGFAGARMGRKGYWIGVGLIYAVIGALSYASFSQGGSVRFGGLSIMIWLYASRLHDLGRSGWWQVPVYGVELVALFGVAGATHGNIGVASAVALLVQTVFTIAIGIPAGQPGANRFGPAPGQKSALAQSEAFR